MNNVKAVDVQPANPLMASCHQRVVPGRIGKVDLLRGCYTFWETVALIAQDIAECGKGADARASIANGTTARQLMKDLYGIDPPAPSVSHYATPESETRILRKWIGKAETEIRRATRLTLKSKRCEASRRQRVKQRVGA